MRTIPASRVYQSVFKDAFVGRTAILVPMSRVPHATPGKIAVNVRIMHLLVKMIPLSAVVMRPSSYTLKLEFVLPVIFLVRTVLILMNFAVIHVRLGSF